MRVEQALAEARVLGVDRLDAQLMLAHLLRQPRSWLLAHDDHVLDAEQAAWLEHALRERAAGLPLAYLLGASEFCGLALRVTRDVLIPRPETELLVDWACELAADASPGAAIDLGTGSGAIALVLKRRFPLWAVTATDASGAALDVARYNGRQLGLAVEWLTGNWWQAVPGRRFSLAVSNPPYVAGEDTHLAALGHEPRTALTPGGDGLSDLSTLIEHAGDHLLAGASLLLEHGHDQHEAVAEAFERAGFSAIATRRDLAGLPRCSGGTWPGG